MDDVRDADWRDRFCGDICFDDAFSSGVVALADGMTAGESRVVAWQLGLVREEFVRARRIPDTSGVPAVSENRAASGRGCDEWA